MALIRAYYFDDCDCGHRDFRTWAAEPSHDAALCPGCGVLRAIQSRTERYTAHVPYTARKRFTPHWNSGFGRHVESVEHLKHLQMLHGTEDAALSRVHSDGSTDYTSRDIDTGKATLRREIAELPAKVAELQEQVGDTMDHDLDYNEDGSMTFTDVRDPEEIA